MNTKNHRIKVIGLRDESNFLFQFNLLVLCFHKNLLFISKMSFRYLLFSTVEKYFQQLKKKFM